MSGELFCDYFERWVEETKLNMVTRVTLKKYTASAASLRAIAPDLLIEDIGKSEYQGIMNAYGEDHAKATCMDFHHQLRACLLDALDEGDIASDPTRKAVIRGKRIEKRKNVLSESELSAVMRLLTESNEMSEKWLLVLIARTGLRFAEALAVTPADFDFEALKLTVSKSWDYKSGTGFAPTKNESSNRVIDIDWRTASEFERLTRGMDASQPVFIQGGCSVYNSTYNTVLARTCRVAGVTEIRVHGLRHTHASVLLACGVSIASISKRLGHSDINTTQSIYLHITDELATHDKRELMAAMCSL